ncbi:MAG: F0F1 ATP synthase subunit A [Planctomycetes bacterium]|nr:F0F1 ATP synthase subunit A [Planctomycetota bacterium]
MFLASEADNFNPVEHLYDRYTVWASLAGDHGAEFVKSWNHAMPGFMAISQHVLMMWLAAAIMIVGVSYVTFLRNSRVPRGLRNFIEPIVTYFRDEIVRPSIKNPHFHGHGHGDSHGDHKELPEHWLADKFVPFFVCMFMFIALVNLLGLIPGSTTASSSLTFTASMALVTLMVYIVGAVYMSIKVEGGVGPGISGFFMNLVPYKFSWKPMDLAIWLMLFGIEFASLVFIKPFALAVRLFANMTAGHCSLLSFLFINLLIGPEIAGWRFATGVPTVAMGVALSALEIFVSILQAYIFTYLSAIFVGLYLVPEH